MKLASTGVVAQAVSYAHHDLDRLLQLWPFVAEQKLLASRLAGGLPVAEGCDRDVCDGRPHGDWPYHHPARADRLPSPESHADPVGEQVCTARQGPEADDHRAMLGFLAAVDHLGRVAREFEHTVKLVRKARLALAARVPAVEAAINAHDASRNRSPNLAGVGPDGRVGTSGVSLEEADRERKGAVEAEASCVCCQLGVSEVGRLKAGMCNTDYESWRRAGQPDRQPWILERRRYLDSKQEGAVIVPLRQPGPYKTLKEVA